MTLTAVLFIVFLVLKLTGLISWSWLWIMSPVWIELVVWIVHITFSAIIDTTQSVKLSKKEDQHWKDIKESWRKRG